MLVPHYVVQCCSACATLKHLDIRVQYAPAVDTTVHHPMLLGGKMPSSAAKALPQLHFRTVLSGPTSRTRHVLQKSVMHSSPALPGRPPLPCCFRFHYYHPPMHTNTTFTKYKACNTILANLQNWLHRNDCPSNQVVLAKQQYTSQKGGQFARLMLL